MLTRAAKYLIPIGTATCMTIFDSPVFAASNRSNPGCVYEEPKKDAYVIMSKCHICVV